jgi:hypothetical protein
MHLHTDRFSAYSDRRSQLPPGWSVVAAINPDDGDYQVRPLDPALIERFMRLPVRADRNAWLAWARRVRVHPGVVRVVQTHDKALADVAPRTWTYVSQVLGALGPGRGQGDLRLLRDVLGGYLAPTWVETLLAVRDSWGGVEGLEAQRLLAGFARDPFARAKVERLRNEGRTDQLETLVYSIEATLLDDGEVSALVGRRDIELRSFEALLTALPGDLGHRLQEAFGASTFTAALLTVGPQDVLHGYRGSAAEALVGQWALQRGTLHRAWALACAVENRLRQMSGHARQRFRREIAEGVAAFIRQLGPAEVAATLRRTPTELELPGIPSPYAAGAAKAAR